MTYKRKIYSFDNRFTFENFVIDTGNQIAHAASLAVSRTPAAQFNPLVICADSGLGKTHLIKAIGNVLIRQRPSFKILYITAEQFTCELINSIRTNTGNSFKKSYIDADILLIDDIYYIENKEETQKELLQILKNIYENKKQIVIASSQPLEEKKSIAYQLLHTFDYTMIVDIQPPEFETREIILRKKASQENILISDEGFNFLASQITTSPRVLEAAIVNLKLIYEIYNEQITIYHIKEHLKHLFDEDKTDTKIIVMNERIDFGTIGLKIDDTIVFEPAKKKYKVGSGAGVPGNGGTLIQWEKGELRSIKSATRFLMRNDFSEESDLYSLWTFEGRTLREIYEQNKIRKITD